MDEQAYGRFAAFFRVRHYEADALGHVNNAAYLHYLEQAAIEHSAAIGLTFERFRELGGLYVVRRHEIDYLRPAAPGDVLQVVTWPIALQASRAIRGYAVYRHPASTDVGANVPNDRFLNVDEEPTGEVVVQAQTIWVWVDPASGRPRRVPNEVYEAFRQANDSVRDEDVNRVN